MEKTPKAKPVIKPVVRPAAPAAPATPVVKPAAASSGKSGVKSPLPGVILEVKVKVGDGVEPEKVARAHGVADFCLARIFLGQNLIAAAPVGQAYADVVKRFYPVVGLDWSSSYVDIACVYGLLYAVA